MKVLSQSVEETAMTAVDFLEKIHTETNTNTNRATVIGLFGDLGSGKTTFTQALARELGVTEDVTSPTFVIMKSYSLKPKTLNLIPDTLIHIDAYRLESGRELASIGFAEILKDPKNLILIEWPEKVIDILPKEAIKINFKFISEFEREIIF